MCSMPLLQLHKHFSFPLLEWFDRHGRKNLPWQQLKGAYPVWISEIMLQQTQVKTVIPYFNRFIRRFPDIETLANASIDDVLAMWSGLGYYSRARFIHQTAKRICLDFANEFPQDINLLKTLPGIGPSTAAAIASLVFHQPTPILDGNVKRVLSRYFLVSGPVHTTSVTKKLWQLAADCMPSSRCADYTQAIMDLGATCCTFKNPSCNSCPLNKTCLAKLQDKVANYPNKHPKKILPTKHQQFILLHTKSNQLYLEKNPPNGLWGGLWCLPSIEESDCAMAFVQHKHGIKTDRAEKLMIIKHSFSHFHLHIKVVSIEVTALMPTIGIDSRFFHPNEINRVGIAKPVNDIIHFFLTHKKKQIDL